MAANGQRQMQMLVTRFERLSRRISLAGLMSGHKAVEAIEAGRVRVDGKVASSNFKVFAEAAVTVDGQGIPPPEPQPRLWGLFKPRKVLCQDAERPGEATLRSFMRKWRDKEVKFTGKAQAVGLDDECLDDKHFVIVCGLAYGADGLVLLTNDGLFAKALTSTDSRILTVYDVKISGDPNVQLLHDWRKGARAGGIDFGRVFCSITKRNGATTRLKVRLVESPERPLDLLFERARMRVNRLQRHSFGPYLVTQLPKDRVIRLPVHSSIQHLCPVADMRQALVPCRGGILSSEGKIRSVGLADSAIVVEDDDDGSIDHDDLHGNPAVVTPSPASRLEDVTGELLAKHAT